MRKILLLAILAIPFFFSAPASIFACSGTCYSSVNCPGGTIVLSQGTCSSGQVCCSGGITNPGSVGSTPSTGSTTTGGNQASGFGNPLNQSTIEGVLGSIMSYLQLIAGTIAMIFIILGGVMYMMSGGSKDMVERAKKTLIFAIAGLAIVIAAPLFYQEIKAILGGGSPGSALQQVLANVLKLLLSIVGFLAIISMVIGSIWMFTAVGDDEKYELGKKTATYSIIGLVIAVAALIIVNQVIALVRGGSASSGSSIINNAANSPMTGSATASPATTSTTYDLVGITEGNMYAYRGSDGNYYELDTSRGGMVPLNRSGVNPVSVVGTLEGSSTTTVYKDTYGNYYKATSNGVTDIGPTDVINRAP